jgi:hypothetical protein
LKIGCYHAHYSNIEHIEQAFSAYDVELIHFVDPGLDRMKQDSDFNDGMVRKKVEETIEWISKCHVDAILVTCTFFTAALQEDDRLSIPVIKIDSALFQSICQSSQPVVMVFTNPNTVQGTTDQFNRYALSKGKDIVIEAHVIEGVFDLIMQGKKEEYILAVSKGLQEIAMQNPHKRVFAAQLSMVPAAQIAEKESGIQIGHQLNDLVRYMNEVIGLFRS